MNGDTARFLLWIPGVVTLAVFVAWLAAALGWLRVAA